MTTSSIVIEGFIKPEREKEYLHLPFDVPAGTVRLDVTFQYSDRIGSHPLLTGGNTMDLGLFDERGIDFLAAGFRGWSGSERDEIFITSTEATPGYLAGALAPGQWHILLGLYKLSPDGCRYHAEIKVTTAEELPAPPGLGEQTAASLPASRPPALFAPWLRGELHCHTWHSDGQLSPAQLVERARMRGMDFLAVSDHNTTAAQRELESLQDPGLILIRGVESTTFKGHFNIWGIPDWIDFRVMTPDGMQAVVEHANALGALTSCGHPKPYGPDWDYKDVTGFHCVEVWNGPWSGLNEMALEYWLSLINSGARKPALGGSDFHRAGEDGRRDIGTPTNWVLVSGGWSAENILKAIHEGHVCVSAGPDGPLLDMTAGEDTPARAGDGLACDESGLIAVQVHVVGGEGCVLRLSDQAQVMLEEEITGTDRLVETRLPVKNSRYVRAELRSADGLMRALSNPIYLDHTASFQ